MAKKFDPPPPKDFVQYGEAGTDESAGASSADTKSLTTTASLITGAVVYLNKLQDRGTIPKGWFQRIIDYLQQRIGRRKSSNEIDDSAELARMAELKAVAVARGERETFSVREAAITVIDEFGIADYDEFGVTHYPDDHEAYIYRLQRNLRN